MTSKDLSKWEEIWNSKNIKDKSKINLEKLIKLDGFDTGVGSYTSNEWLRMTKHFADINEITDGQNIYDITVQEHFFMLLKIILILIVLYRLQ